MKRLFAFVILLAALGVLTKLAFKPGLPAARRKSESGAAATGQVGVSRTQDPLVDLAQRYSEGTAEERRLVARVAERFRQTAIAVERTDGLRGLRLLDRLDLEAVYLYEKHPSEFRRLRELMNDTAAADVLLHWREYFGLKRADDTDRAVLVSELAALSPRERRLAARYPAALPLFLADPSGTSELIEAFQNDDASLGEVLSVLSLISLEHGAADLRAAMRTIENHRELALDAFRQHGLEGFALVCLYAPVLDVLGTALPLEQSLILLRVNSQYVDELLLTHRPETVAGHLRHVGATGLVEAAAGSAEGLRLVVEYGDRGERALTSAGSDAADVVFGDFSDPVLRNQAVAALGARADGSGGAGQVRSRPRLSRDPAGPRRGGHPPGRSGRHRPGSSDSAAIERAQVVHRVARQAGAPGLRR